MVQQSETLIVEQTKIDTELFTALTTKEDHSDSAGRDSSTTDQCHHSSTYWYHG